MRHPLILAIQWATLDQLSGGRTILAVCNGESAKVGPEYAAELEVMQVASRERVGRVEENIEILRNAWGPGAFSFAGRFHQFDDVEVLPKPVQDRPPIVIAANPPPNADPVVEERILRRVARLADGWQSALVPPDVFARRWATILSYADDYGRREELRHSSVHLMVNVSDDERRARRESIDFLDKYYGEGHLTDEMLSYWLLAGSPARIQDGLAAFLAAGCSTPIVRFTSWDQHTQLERFVTEVAPALTTAGSGPGRTPSVPEHTPEPSAA
jgi:alkanesulfonate monooxygenase SsuD/methylene tetrahydromethanopterin reductase-like flavin-dependent oxidoreductase (luciferase family)